MDDKFITRNTLLQRAVVHSDDDSWKELSSYYSQFILMVLRKMRVPECDCDDLAQNVLIKLWKKLETFDSSKGSFRGWLGTIIRNEVINHSNKIVRENKRNENYLNIVETLSDSDGELNALIEKEWISFVVKLAMSRLEEIFIGNAVEVLKLTLDEVSPEEIARRLNIKVFTVYALRNRAKKRLREEVESLIHELDA